MNKEKVKRILDAFDDMYPDAQCELVHHNELELLIAVMLSAQTCLLYTSPSPRDRG